MGSLVRYLRKKISPQYADRERFHRAVGYRPSLKKPKTFSEKILFRKHNWANTLFPSCTDKVLAKEYVRSIIGDKIVIDNYYVGDQLSFDLVRDYLSKYNSFMIKANHDCGTSFIVTKNDSDDKIAHIVNEVNSKLKQDYGKLFYESWYSKIKPKVLFEKKLNYDNEKHGLIDYKFHIFNNKKENEKIVVLQVNFDTEVNRNQIFVDEDLNWLPFSMGIPVIKTTLDRPDNYNDMLNIAKNIANDFSYVRVDLYNLAGQIYFGEMTFSHQGGHCRFSNYCYDLWMGSLWKGDPRN